MQEAGIVGYGTYIPIQRIKTEEVVKEREKGKKDLQDILYKTRERLLLRVKSLAGEFEDTTTIGTEAVDNALRMAQISPNDIGAVYAGSESPPYAVGSIALKAHGIFGIQNRCYAVGMESACNAGMQAVSDIRSKVLTGEINYGLAIGSDVAQARKGDPLEYAAGSGAVAFVIGSQNIVAKIVDTVPFTDNIEDFWRRDLVPVPSHHGKTTVQEYKKCVIGAIEEMLKKHKEIKLRDFHCITSHQPSGYMVNKTFESLTESDPEKIKDLRDKSLFERIRITEEDIEKKIKPWLIVLDTGNTYSASTPMAIASMLDEVQPGTKILAVSYGSGASAIATWLETTDEILSKRGLVPTERGLVPTVKDYVRRRHEVGFETYSHYIGRFARNYWPFHQMRPSYIGEIEPIGEDRIRIGLCPKCETVYYQFREHCLKEDHSSLPLISKELPVVGRLKSVKKIPLIKSIKSRMNCFDLYNGNNVLLVDYEKKTEMRRGKKTETINLTEGTIVEFSMRRLDHEGLRGIIHYGPAYRELYRYSYPAYKASLKDRGEQLELALHTGQLKTVPN